MDHRLQQYLVDKYADFFQEVYNAESPMALGINCGDGWFHILNYTCSRLKHILQLNKNPLTNFKFEQIKEKFGSLRLHYTYSPASEDSEKGVWVDASIHATIHNAEYQSTLVCENCGAPPNRTKQNSEGNFICKFCLSVDKK